MDRRGPSGLLSGIPDCLQFGLTTLMEAEQLLQITKVCFMVIAINSYN
jgi:hypothetical protein